MGGLQLVYAFHSGGKEAGDVGEGALEVQSERDCDMGRGCPIGKAHGAHNGARSGGLALHSGRRKRILERIFDRESFVSAIERGEDCLGFVPQGQCAACVAQDLVELGFRLAAQPILIDLVGMPGLGIVGEAIKGEFRKVCEVERCLQRDLAFVLGGNGDDAPQC